MASKRSHEGYLLVDHRSSPGVPSAPEGTVLESATITCSHCQRVVVLNPDRTRERAWCRKCDHYVCDGCAPAASLGDCMSFARFADKYLGDAYHKEQAEKGYALGSGGPDPSLLPLPVRLGEPGNLTDSPLSINTPPPTVLVARS